MANFQENKDFWMKLTGNHPAIQKQVNPKMILDQALAQRSQHDVIFHNLHLALESAAIAAYYYNELYHSKHIKSEWKSQMESARDKCQRLVTMTRRYSGQKCVDLIEERSYLFYKAIGYLALVDTKDIDLFNEVLSEVVVDTTAIRLSETKIQ